MSVFEVTIFSHFHGRNFKNIRICTLIRMKKILILDMITLMITILILVRIYYQFPFFKLLIFQDFKRSQNASLSSTLFFLSFINHHHFPQFLKFCFLLLYPLNWSLSKQPKEPKWPPLDPFSTPRLLLDPLVLFRPL